MYTQSTGCFWVLRRGIGLVLFMLLWAFNLMLFEETATDTLNTGSSKVIFPALYTQAVSFILPVSALMMLWLSIKSQKQGVNRGISIGAFLTAILVIVNWIYLAYVPNSIVKRFFQLDESINKPVVYNVSWNDLTSLVPLNFVALLSIVLITITISRVYSRSI